jgi:hypothetical protein
MKVSMLATVSGLFFIAGNAMAKVKTCQTPTEIKVHINTSAADEFCFHRVVDPTVGLFSGKSISADRQLAPTLDVAFLNTEKYFDDAQALCGSLGVDWHAPESNKQTASPQAIDNTKSLEAVGEYFAGTTEGWFWSSSTVSTDTYRPWVVNLQNGYSDYFSKNDRVNVLCVRP